MAVGDFREHEVERGEDVEIDHDRIGDIADEVRQFTQDAVDFGALFQANFLNLVVDRHDGLRLDEERLTRCRLVVDDPTERLAVFHLDRDDVTVVPNRDDGVRQHLRVVPEDVVDP